MDVVLSRLLASLAGIVIGLREGVVRVEVLDGGVVCGHELGWSFLRSWFERWSEVNVKLGMLIVGYASVVMVSLRMMLKREAARRGSGLSFYQNLGIA